MDEALEIVNWGEKQGGELKWLEYLLEGAPTLLTAFTQHMCARATDITRGLNKWLTSPDPFCLLLRRFVLMPHFPLA